jgi:hypothetical protein
VKEMEPSPKEVKSSSGQLINYSEEKNGFNLNNFFQPFIILTRPVLTTGWVNRPG